MDGTSHIDREFDAAVGELLLGAAIAPASGFDFGLLHGVCLQKRIEVLLLTPTPAVVVVLDLAVFQLADSRVSPIGQLDGQAGDFARCSPV